MPKREWLGEAAELAVYAALVTGYVLVVLALLDRPLLHVYRSHRVTYAAVAVGLVIGQGIVLDLVTSALIRLFGRRG